MYKKYVQLRVWNDRHNKWFYYDRPGNHLGMINIHSEEANEVTNSEGNTGSAIVYILILILWLFAAYRFWLVWAYKLNYDEVINYSIYLVLFGFVRSSRNANVRKFVCLDKTCLEDTIFIFCFRFIMMS